MLDKLAGQSGLWIIFCIVAWVIFNSRFYVQWLASERKKRSVIPIAFWYQTAIGSFMLLLWAWHTTSALGAVSQCFTLVPCGRNLIHIWRERGVLSRRLHHATHIAVAIVVVLGIFVVYAASMSEINDHQDSSAAEVKWAVLWLAIGLIGQALFALRVFIQWAITEMRRKSIVPSSFWYISVVATVLQAIAFAARGGGDWVYALGMISNLFVYLRNIWFLHRGGNEAAIKAE